MRVMEQTQDVQVMIVDDFEVLRSGLAMMFSEIDGFGVIGEASDGSEAIEKNEELNPDIILMDLNMPGGMDGITATRRIKAVDPDVKIVILSHFDEGSKVYAAFAAGADNYLTKSNAPVSKISQTLTDAINGQATIDPQLSRMLIDAATNSDQNELDLTDRQLQVLKLVEVGLTNAEIGTRLNIAESTVKTHIRHIFSRLNVSNRTEAAYIASTITDNRSDHDG